MHEKDKNKIAIDTQHIIEYSQPTLTLVARYLFLDTHTHTQNSQSVIIRPRKIICFHRARKATASKIALTNHSRLYSYTETTTCAIPKYLVAVNNEQKKKINALLTDIINTTDVADCDVVACICGRK